MGLVVHDGLTAEHVVSIAVDDDFAVSSHHDTLLGDNKRVDLNHVAVFGPEN